MKTVSNAGSCDDRRDHDVARSLAAAGLELTAKIGAGASSTVYAARTTRPWRDVPADQEVAVKILHRELGADPRAVEHLRREGELGLALRSPHVARIHGVETVEHDSDSITFLVMERIAGHTLRQFLDQNGPAVEDLARRIGVEAAEGLAALHRIGVIHRDVKPENLALTPDGHVVVMDLGLARRLGSRPSDSGFFGSLGYAAPELLGGDGPGPGSDLYALGLVLFEVVTGRHPFADAEGGDAMIDAHLHRTPPRTSHLQPRVSAFLERLIDDLLEKRPGVRPADAEVVATALRDGEASDYWRRHGLANPILASRQRLHLLRRFAPAGFVGRRVERRQLDRMFRRAGTNRGSAVAITGAQGSGRRRLLDECLDSWLRGSRDITLLGGRASRLAERADEAPFPAMLLDWFLGGEGADSPQAVDRLQTRIRTDTGWDDADAARLAEIACGTSTGDSPEVRADWLVRGLLSIPQSGRLTVLRIESAERLSPAGRLVARRLAEAAGALPLLLIVVSAPGQRLLGPRHPSLSVEGLATDEFTALGSALFEAGQTPGAMLRRACPVLGGSPGHLITALEDLAARGELAGRPGSYRLLELDAELRPPRPLLERIGQRVRELPPEVGYALKAAAVLGESFPLTDLAAVTGRPELELLEALSAFRGRVVGSEHGVTFFRHRDYRRAMLDLIPTEARRRLHRAAAWVLEERGAAALEVGLHLSRAGEHRTAAPMLLEGLERLVQSWSWDAARRISERLRLHLAALPTDAVTSGLRLRHALLTARVEEAAGRWLIAVRSYRRARTLGRALDAPVARAEANLGLAEAARRRGRLRLAQRLIRSAEGMVAGAGDDPGRAVAARTAAKLARVAGELGEAEAALPPLRESLDRLPAGDTALRPWLRVELARLLALRTHFRSAQRQLHLAERAWHRDADDHGLLEVQLERGCSMAWLGNRDAATRAFENALDRARRIGESGAIARASLGLGDLAIGRGDRSAATSLYFDAFAAATAAGEVHLRSAAGLRLRARGVVVDAAVPDVTTLPPALAIAWLLVQASSLDDPESAARLIEDAARLEQAHTVPLDLRFELLWAKRDQQGAQQLAEEVAGRLAPGSTRRRFRARIRTKVASPYGP